MNATLTIDKAGRIVIPKAVRDGMNLSAGDSIEMEFEGQEVTLKAVKPPSRLKKKNGIWVMGGTGKTITLEEMNKVIQDIRDQRDRDNLGKFL